MSKPAAHPEPPVPPPAAESSGQADAAADALAAFHPATQTWFREAFAEPTGAQCRAWPPIAAGKSTLLLAPTGSGKTLAAFLASLDRVMFDRSAGAKAPGEQAADTPEERVRVLYISPLKALGVDIDRNLRAPIAGIRAVANRTGQAVHEPTVAIRSGDTTSRDRQAINRHPPDVLITTPESLYLMLTSNAEAVLQGVETVIIDEIHVMAPTKRGAHLFLSLERLERRRRQANPEAPPLQRIGLSATQRPLDEIARLLGGADGTADPDEPVAPRPVEIVDASAPKKLDLLVEVPVEDMARLGEGAFGRGADPVGGGPMRGGFDGGEPDVDVLGGDGLDDSAGGSIDGNAAMGSPFSSPTPPSIWPSIHPRLVELIRAHRSTMIFVNSRRLAERLATAINELAAEDDPEAGEIALAHHGSVAKDKRAAIEDRLKRGQLPAIVATSSLELGIDMGAVDLVIQIEAPPSIASGMQRIGRAGHRVGATSRGVVFPKYRGDLLACSAATGRMLAGRVEETFYPRNPLDLLAQQIVAVTARESIDVDELYALVRGAASFADLPRSSFEGVLDLLAGRYPSDEFAELRPRINWDRLAGVISARRGAQRLAVLNGGTIPDRGLYGVFLAGEGPDGAGGSRVGELDEEMVFETQPGDVFLLGASSWRVLDITRDRVIVAPAPGEPGRMPFWRGDAPGRPLEFGRAIGKLSRELLAEEQGAARTRLREDHALDEKAADNLLRYLAEQQEATGEAPSDRAIVAEAFLDEIGDWRICLLSPFGARVHAPWAIAVAGRLREEGYGEVDLNWGDDGLIFRLPESDTPPDVDRFIPRADEVEELISRQLGSTALFAARFRENAARALLLPKRRPQGRTPLWMQRRRSADLLQVAARYPSFPMLLETYRECLQDVFDLPGLVGLLRDIERRAVQVVRAETSAPSPFAASLLFNYTANFLYEGDAPLAERRAAALSLDHVQLRELLGSADLRELLDEEVIAQVALEAAKLDRPLVRDADDVHDLLLGVGDLSREEIAARCNPEHGGAAELDAWLQALQDANRVIAVRVASEPRYAAAEDAARLRDALGANPPSGLPAAFLEMVATPLDDLVSRYARTHGPFTAGQAAQRLGLGESPVTGALDRLVEAGRVIAGEFVTGLGRRQWCDATVLRQIKRRSLARLRQQVEAAPAAALARFLPVWQGVTKPRRGLDALLDAIEQLQGAPLPASVLESEVLAARVADYQPAQLDELFLAGEVAWRGIESLGVSDGRIALYLTDQAPLLALPPEPTGEQDKNGKAPRGDSGDATPPDPAVEAVLALLAERGALRFDQIVDATGAFGNDLVNALWRLVWEGRVTNDTLAPVRSLVKASSSAGKTPGRRNGRPRTRGARFRSRRREHLPGSEGRWSLAPAATASPTERQAAVAAQLLQRYGVFTRSLASRESAPGGFAALYPVFKAMEEAGKARRGYFVEGLGGAQFASAGADDLLRAEAADDAEAVLLAATDPANAYGAALPWPSADDAGGGADKDRLKPQRAVGSLVVMVGGELVAYASRNGARMATTFADAEPLRSQQIVAVAKRLARRARTHGSLMIEEIDGRRPAASPLAEPLLSAGFVAINRGYVHRGE